MARALLIQGLPSSGKTQSIFPSETIGITGLEPKETVLLNILKKELPMKGADKHYYTIDSKRGKDPKSWGNLKTPQSPDEVIEIIQNVNKYMAHIKNIVIDDLQYLFTSKFMDKALETGYQKWNEIGVFGSKPYLWVTQNKNELREDLTIFFIAHTEEYEVEATGKQVVKIKTAGKLVDNYIALESLFTIILHATKIVKRKGGIEYKFKTRPEYEKDSTRSPVGMFPEQFINNDLGLVKQLMLEYYKG